MEKLFRVPSDPSPSLAGEALPAGNVRLQNRHLIIAGETAANAFGDEIQVYQMYYANLGTLLLAPMSDTTFRQAHPDCGLVMLKLRNAQGDKSLSMEEIIIDNELDASDRDLTANGAPGLRMLQVMLK
jgi:hypothetical protein